MPFFPSGAVSGQLAASVLAAFLSRTDGDGSIKRCNRYKFLK